MTFNPRMRTWTVESVDPDMGGGYTVLCDGCSVNWFPGYDRAVNEAQHHNRAEILRAHRRLGSAS